MSVYLVLVLLCENLVVVLVVVCRSLLPQMPPASPIEDWGTAIPIEDRDWTIPERLRLCGVTSRNGHSARGTVEAGVDWTSFAKDSFSRYMNVSLTEHNSMIRGGIRAWFRSCGQSRNSLFVDCIWQEGEGVKEDRIGCWVQKESQEEEDCDMNPREGCKHWCTSTKDSVKKM
ncbi:hypothetical protein F2Q69_00027546 [Brassica cretica]|uniref:SCP domain-containing protein n=1 Tax=Brassica cretica TaxID=69181 RepID=A0A8S9RXE9_BRACR|nr:hypothetical protein F2Q69_00027546 [Brassica cretica]